jgi:diguanylate cyclase (GGDEF)-like protein
MGASGGIFRKNPVFEVEARLILADAGGMRAATLPPLPRVEELLKAFQEQSLSLRFQPDVEESYQQMRSGPRLKSFRLTGLTGLFLYDLFLFLDSPLFGLDFGRSLVVRLGLVTPLALLTIAAAGLVRGFWQELLIGFSMLPAAAGLLFLYQGTPSLVGIGQTALIIVLMYSSGVIRPGFRGSALALPVWLAGDSIFLAWNGELSGSQSVQAVSLVWTAAGIALMTSFWLERHERSGYLLQMRNDAQNAALNAINGELVRLSMVDPLTGIPNRRAFDAALKAAWSCAATLRQPLAILMMDLDEFERFNELHGRPYGDTVLFHVARRLRDCLGDAAMVARYGGEEFIALMPEMDLARAVERASQVCQCVRATSLPPSAGHYGVTVTISIGVASLIPEAGLSAVELLRTADANLYQAKYLGRNRVFPAA